MEPNDCKNLDAFARNPLTKCLDTGGAADSVMAQIPDSFPPATYHAPF